MSKNSRGRTKPSLGREILLPVVVLCCICLVIGILAFDRMPSTIGDNAEFAILGMALAKGSGFRYINHPELRPATKYPPGFPLLLAGWIRIFGDTMARIKVQVLICYMLVVVVTLLLARRFLDQRFGIIAALVIASSSSVVAYSYQVLSDIPYTLFSLLAIVLLLGSTGKRTNTILGIAMCLWAYFTRTAGISLVFAATLFFLLRRRRKEALLLIIGFVLVSGLWSLRNWYLTGESSRYLGLFLSADPYDPDQGFVTLIGLLRRAGVNLGAYIGGLIPISIFPSLFLGLERSQVSPELKAISYAVVAITVIGGYSLRRKGLLVNLYLLGYMGIYLAWPEVWRSERFMIPVAPVIAIYFLQGAVKTVTYFGSRRLVAMAVCLALMATNAVALSKHIRRERGYRPGWAEYFETATWVSENTDPDSVVLCRKPFLFYIFSRRKTISYPYTRDSAAMEDYLMTTQPDYIIIDNYGSATTQRYLLPVLRTMTDRLQTVYITEAPVNVVLRFSSREVRPEG